MKSADVLATQALTAADFAALMAALPLPSRSVIAIAVSGGPDSMALAYCLQRWCQSQHQTLRVLIVDHRLRQESQAEAEAVSARLQAWGLPVDILVWQHEDVPSRLHHTARDARYALLTEACRKADITDLFLAHHLDDQAETVLMRFAKGSGIDGLAGMSEQQKRGGVTLWRPLLSVPKTRLIATCALAGIPYVTDPSNEARRFARGRLRQVMPLLADEGMDAARLGDLARRAHDASEALRFFTESFLRAHSRRDITGALWLDRPALRQQPLAIVMRALAACLQHIHPTPYAPDDAPLRELAMAVLGDGPLSAFTLNGCLTYGTERHIIVLRELSAITDAPLLASGQSVDWDQRLRIEAPRRDTAKPSDGWIIKALGVQEHTALDALWPDFRKQVPQGRLRATWPAFWQAGKPALVPLPEAAPSGSTGGAKAVFLRPWPPCLTDSVTTGIVEN